MSGLLKLLLAVAAYCAAVAAATYIVVGVLWLMSGVAV